VLIREVVDARIHDVLTAVAPGVATVGIEIVVQNPHDEARRLAWKHLQEKYPKWVRVMDANDVHAPIFDMVVLEEVNHQTLPDLKKHKLVPVAEKGVATFDPIEEKGNGFLFHRSAWSLFAALVRAQETYRFPYDWENLVKAVGRS
jgi:hypothetical protein